MSRLRAEDFLFEGEALPRRLSDIGIDLPSPAEQDGYDEQYAAIPDRAKAWEALGQHLDEILHDARAWHTAHGGRPFFENGDELYELELIELAYPLYKDRTHPVAREYLIRVGTALPVMIDLQRLAQREKLKERLNIAAIAARTAVQCGTAEAMEAALKAERDVHTARRAIRAVRAAVSARASEDWAARRRYILSMGFIVS
ncbi:hypothetical protein EXIGLDRAFT_769898 [Exidia glandulosa HHB12029]|uniref:Uncharacterized protein n=1 Tax=Exidia glandulosa HHB12029 TaxID=1314781 RepID=A0A165H4X4_EXIGL|nr:hypothetical protein EXIGLDRAFT_769898 [Exidia glandulosa HHB12029]